MRNHLLFAIPLTVILVTLLLLHAYWALGGRLGGAYTVPTINGRRIFDPTPLATWVVCALLGIALILVIGKAGWIGTGPFPVLFDVGIWILGLVFMLRAVGNLRTFGFFKTLTGTPFAEVGQLSLFAALLTARAAGRRVSTIATGVKPTRDFEYCEDSEKPKAHRALSGS